MIRTESVSSAALPSLEKGETIYSWASRTYLILGGSVGWFSKTLFGNTRASRSHDVPIGLAHLNSVTNGSLGSPRDLIATNTSLGGFLPYLSPTRREAVTDAIIGGDSALGLLRVGDRASRLSRLPTLRSCRVCVELDRDVVGVGCWRVVHQLPAVWVCPYHRVPLAENQSTAGSWQLPERTDPIRKSSLTLDASVQGLLAATAVSTAAFELREIDLSSIRRAAIERLCQNGLVSNPSRLPIEKMHKSFLASPIGRAVGGYEPLRTVLANEAWLGDLLRNRAAPHPLRWALAWCWIWSDADDVTTAQAFREAAHGRNATALGCAQLELPLDELNRAERMCISRLLEAVHSASSLEQIAVQVGAKVSEVSRWFKRYPEIRNRWWSGVREARLSTKRERVELSIAQDQLSSRRALISSCNSEISWLRRNEPATAERLLARVPPDRSPQRVLFE